MKIKFIIKEMCFVYMRNKSILLLGLLFIFGCSTSREFVMPFINLGMSFPGRILPIQNSDKDWVFRAWINNGTSIDRIITVSKDSLGEYNAHLIEFGVFTDRKRDVRINNIFEVEPKSGYDKFIQTIDSLALENYETQENFPITISHEPFSLYVIELKNGDNYHQFSFKTYFPMSNTNEKLKPGNKYELIEKLLFNEFDYKFYVK